MVSAREAFQVAESHRSAANAADGNAASKIAG